MEISVVDVEGNLIQAVKARHWLLGPRIVGARIPESSFRIVTREAAPALRLVARRLRDRPSLGTGAHDLDVRYGDVRTLRLEAADLVRLADALAELRSVVDRAEHQHAAAEHELRMRDHPVGARDDEVLLEADHATEPARWRRARRGSAARG